MENLKQVYEAERDVRDSDIPEIWKERTYSSNSS